MGGEINPLMANHGVDQGDIQNATSREGEWNGRERKIWNASAGRDIMSGLLCNHVDVGKSKSRFRMGGWKSIPHGRTRHRSSGGIQNSMRGEGSTLHANATRHNISQSAAAYCRCRELEIRCRNMAASGWLNRMAAFPGTRNMMSELAGVQHFPEGEIWCQNMHGDA